MDKLELFNNLMILAAADGKLTQEEVAFLAVRAEDLGISQDDVESAIAGASSDAAELVLPLDGPQRGELLQQMITLMAVILFRGITAVIIVAMAPSLGVFWTLGMLRFFDFQDNPFNDIVLPVLLSLVGLTDGVHLMVQIRRLRASGLSERDAARAGIRQVGLACALTSLTTAIGFGSQWRPHVWRRSARRCVCPALPRSVAASIPAWCF